MAHSVKRHLLCKELLAANTIVNMYMFYFFIFIAHIYIYFSFVKLIYSVDIASEESHFVGYSAINHYYYHYYYYYN